MDDLNLKADILAQFKPFLDNFFKYSSGKLHSVHLIGSGVTQDYDPKISDINSVMVLRKAADLVRFSIPILKLSDYFCVEGIPGRGLASVLDLDLCTLVCTNTPMKSIKE
ncbi:MAG: hypothetical protein PVF37_13180 [Desulfobacterales bacterium]